MADSLSLNSGCFSSNSSNSFNISSYTGYLLNLHHLYSILCLILPRFSSKWFILFSTHYVHSNKVVKFNSPYSCNINYSIKLYLGILYSISNIYSTIFNNINNNNYNNDYLILKKVSKSTYIFSSFYNSPYLYLI